MHYPAFQKWSIELSQQADLVGFACPISFLFLLYFISQGKKKKKKKEKE